MIVGDLKTIRYILDKIKKRPDVAKITGYDRVAIEIFIQSLERTIKRYEKEARRVRKYYR